MNDPAEIIVVTNRKGGTGKTTTSVNLAAEFAAMGRRVLLIDMDPSTPNLRGFYGTAPFGQAVR